MFLRARAQCDPLPHRITQCPAPSKDARFDGRFVETHDPTRVGISLYTVQQHLNPDTFVGILSGFRIRTLDTIGIPTLLSGKCRDSRSWTSSRVLRGASSSC